MANKEIKIERKYVDVDTTYETVLKWDKEGHTMVFVSSTDLFLTLTLGQLDELSAKTRKIYRFAKMDNDKHKGAFKDDLLDLIGAEVIYGSPEDQLRVELDGTEDFVVQWIRPDQLRAYAVLGWVAVTDELKTQRGLRSEGIHAVGKNELILVKTSKVNKAKLDRDKDAKYADLIEGTKASLQYQAKEAGLDHQSEFSSERYKTN